MKTLRIPAADDHRVLRQGMQALLEVLMLRKLGTHSLSGLIRCALRNKIVQFQGVPNPTMADAKLKLLRVRNPDSTPRAVPAQRVSSPKAPLSQLCKDCTRACAHVHAFVISADPTL